MSEQKTLYIIWDDIIFGQNQIEFDIRRLKIILHPVKVAGVIKSLNVVKGEYFNRLYGKKAFKLTFQNGILQQSREASPGWSRLLDAIEMVQEYYSIKYKHKKFGLLRKHHNLEAPEVLELYDSLLLKTDYLKYLAQRINTEFKLIPVLEFSNGHEEDSFLFRFKNRNEDVLIVWENVNPNRATYIFKFNEEKRKDVLQKIEQFITSTEYDHKRSLLSGSDLLSKQIKRELCFYKKNSHYGFDDFKAEMEYLIAYS